MKRETSSRLGILLRRHRAARGWTQEDLAERTGLSIRTIRNLERGATASPRRRSVWLIADAFRLSEGDRDRLLASASGTVAPVAVAGDGRPPGGLPSAGTPGSPGSGAPAIPGPPATSSSSAARPHMAATPPISAPAPPPAALPAFGLHQWLPTWPVPRLLPPAVPHFVGRQEAIAELSAVLERASASLGAVPVAVLHGAPGIGKTALAVHWGHRVAERFPDGQLYVDFRRPGNDVMDATRKAVRFLLWALGVPQEYVPDGFDEQVGVYRSLMAGKRILTILDGAPSASGIRPLLAGGATSMTVVTSRDALPGLVAVEGVQPIGLPPFTEQEARGFLAHRLGAERTAAEAPAVDALVELGAGLPLALSIASARAQTRRGLSLSEVVADLRAGGMRLECGDGEPVISDISGPCGHRR